MNFYETSIAIRCVHCISVYHTWINNISIELQKLFKNVLRASVIWIIIKHTLHEIIRSLLCNVASCCQGDLRCNSNSLKRLYENRVTFRDKFLPSLHFIFILRTSIKIRSRPTTYPPLYEQTRKTVLHFHRLVTASHATSFLKHRYRLGAALNRRLRV